MPAPTSPQDFSDGFDQCPSRRTRRVPSDGMPVAIRFKPEPQQEMGIGHCSIRIRPCRTNTDRKDQCHTSFARRFAIRRTGARRNRRTACSGNRNIRTKLLFTMSENQASPTKTGPQWVFYDKLWRRQLLTELFTRPGSQSACPTRLPDRWHGGARRNRTDDLLLAKQALSQLSYGPNKPGAPQGEWWAWVDSNYRPHPYQGCALTD